MLLGLPEDVLETISSDEQKVDNCLRKMVSRWLRQVNPPPTWKDLVDAVKTVNPQKAEEIRNQCCV